MFQEKKDLTKKWDYFDSATAEEERNIQKARKYFTKDIDFWKEVFNMLYDVFKTITESYSDKMPCSKKASLYILSRLLMSSKASLDLLIKGYYYDYAVVERSIWESVALINLFSRDEESAKEWLAFKRLDIPKWKLVHHLWPTTPTKKMTATINRAYASQSDYVHSTFHAVFSVFLQQLSQKKRSFYVPRFQKSLVADLISAPPSALALAYLLDLYKKELKEDFKNKVVGLIGEKVENWKARGLFQNGDFE